MRFLTQSPDQWRRRESKREHLEVSRETSGYDARDGNADMPTNSLEGNRGATDCDARHRAALHRAKDFAIAGDDVGCHAELRRAARLLGLEAR